jgi:hypothetical protein
VADLDLDDIAVRPEGIGGLVGLSSAERDAVVAAVRSAQSMCEDPVPADAPEPLQWTRVHEPALDALREALAPFGADR